MRTVFTCLLFVGLSQAIDLYLCPTASFPPRLSAGQASAALSHHLGLDYFESVWDYPELSSSIAQTEPFVGKGSRNALLLTISSNVAKDIIPESLTSPISIISDISPSSLSSLVPTYIRRAQHTYNHVFSQRPNSLGVPRILDIFSIPSYASEVFLTEAAALVDFLESGTTDSFGAFELTGLEELAAHYGRSSDQYTLAAELLRNSLSTAVSKTDFKLALLTYSPSSAPQKRQDAGALQPPQMPLPQPAPVEPISSISTCFTTKDACGNSTSSCSGRGECMQASKAGKTCFVCTCMATKSAKGKTEHWVGNACERKDVSGPFVLLTGTVITLLLLVGGSIALLSAIGSQELPSTLTGSGAGGPRRD